MAKFEVKNSEGKKVAEAELAAEVYGIEPNIHVMHHIVKCQMASWRQGTQSAKGRSEVSGGGKKPWRQKGTGRARQGSIRAAQWRHGGVVFAPKPRSYAKRMNNKEVKLAMRSALSAKLADGELVLVDDYGFEKPSTKAAVAMLKALGLERQGRSREHPDGQAQDQARALCRRQDPFLEEGHRHAGRGRHHRGLWQPGLRLAAVE